MRNKQQSVLARIAQEDISEALKKAKEQNQVTAGDPGTGAPPEQGEAIIAADTGVPATVAQQVEQSQQIADANIGGMTPVGQPVEDIKPIVQAVPAEQGNSNVAAVANATEQPLGPFDSVIKEIFDRSRSAPQEGAMTQASVVTAPVEGNTAQPTVDNPAIPAEPAPVDGNVTPEGIDVQDQGSNPTPTGVVTEPTDVVPAGATDRLVSFFGGRDAKFISTLEDTSDASQQFPALAKAHSEVFYDAGRPRTVAEVIQFVQGQGDQAAPISGDQPEVPGESPAAQVADEIAAVDAAVQGVATGAQQVEAQLADDQNAGTVAPVTGPGVETPAEAPPVDQVTEVDELAGELQAEQPAPVTDAPTGDSMDPQAGDEAAVVNDPPSPDEAPEANAQPGETPVEDPPLVPEQSEATPVEAAAPQEPPVPEPAPETTADETTSPEGTETPEPGGDENAEAEPAAEIPVDAEATDGTEGEGKPSDPLATDEEIPAASAEQGEQADGESTDTPETDAVDAAAPETGEETTEVDAEVVATPEADDTPADVDVEVDETVTETPVEEPTAEAPTIPPAGGEVKELAGGGDQAPLEDNASAGGNPVAGPELGELGETGTPAEDATATPVVDTPADVEAVDATAAAPDAAPAAPIEPSAEAPAVAETPEIPAPGTDEAANAIAEGEAAAAAEQPVSPDPITGDGVGEGPLDSDQISGLLNSGRPAEEIVEIMRQKGVQGTDVTPPAQDAPAELGEPVTPDVNADVPNGDAANLNGEPVQATDEPESEDEDEKSINESQQSADSIEAKQDEVDVMIDEAAGVSSRLGEVAEMVADSMDDVEKGDGKGKGMDEKTARLVDIAVESLCAQAGFTPKRSQAVSLESFADEDRRFPNTKIALENITFDIARIKAAIITFIKKSIQWFLDMVRERFQHQLVLRKMIMQLRARAETAKDANTNIMIDSGAFVEFLSFNSGISASLEKDILFYGQIMKAAMNDLGSWSKEMARSMEILGNTKGTSVSTFKPMPFAAAGHDMSSNEKRSYGFYETFAKVTRTDELIGGKVIINVEVGDEKHTTRDKYGKDLNSQTSESYLGNQMGLSLVDRPKNGTAPEQVLALSPADVVSLCDAVLKLLDDIVAVKKATQEITGFKEAVKKAVENVSNRTQGLEEDAQGIADLQVVKAAMRAVDLPSGALIAHALRVANAAYTFGRDSLEAGQVK